MVPDVANKIFVTDQKIGKFETLKRKIKKKMKKAPLFELSPHLQKVGGIKRFLEPSPEKYFTVSTPNLWKYIFLK